MSFICRLRMDSVVVGRVRHGIEITFAPEVALEVRIEVTAFLGRSAGVIVKKPTGSGEMLSAIIPLKAMGVPQSALFEQAVADTEVTMEGKENRGIMIRLEGLNTKEVLHAAGMFFSGFDMVVSWSNKEGVHCLDSVFIALALAPTPNEQQN